MITNAYQLSVCNDIINRARDKKLKGVTLGKWDLPRFSKVTDISPSTTLHGFCTMHTNYPIIFILFIIIVNSKIK